MSVSKVFVVMEPTRIVDGGEPVRVYDISSAEEYGDIIDPAILPRSIIGQPMDWVTAQVRRELWDFTSDDYLLLLGDPIAIGITCAVASDITGGDVNVLRWSPKDHSYQPETFNIHKRARSKTNDQHDGTDGSRLDERSKRVRIAFRKNYER